MICCHIEWLGLTLVFDGRQSMTTELPAEQLKNGPSEFIIENQQLIRLRLAAKGLFLGVCICRSPPMATQAMEAWRSGWLILNTKVKIGRGQSFYCFAFVFCRYICRVDAESFTWCNSKDRVCVCAVASSPQPCWVLPFVSQMVSDPPLLPSQFDISTARNSCRVCRTRQGVCRW